MIIPYKKSLEEKANLKLIVNNDIFIRVISKKDVSLTYLNWLKNDEIMKFTEQNKKNHTLGSTIKFVEEKFQSKFDFLFGIFLNNNHLGNIKLGPINWDKKDAQISFFLGEKKFWGKGIMFKVIKKLLSFAFQTLRLIEIKAGYDKKNIASAKIFKKCNFRITKTLTKPISNSKKKRVIVYVCKKNI